MKLTENFYVKEILTSESRPDLLEDVVLTESHILRAKLHAEGALQPIRNRWGMVSIESWHRTERLNKALKGAEYSDHLEYETTDFVIDEFRGLDKMFDVFKWIANSTIPYRQIIYYQKSNINFIHISSNYPGKDYKHQRLIKGVEGFREW